MRLPPEIRSEDMQQLSEQLQLSPEQTAFITDVHGRYLQTVSDWCKATLVPLCDASRDVAEFQGDPSEYQLLMAELMPRRHQAVDAQLRLDRALFDELEQVLGELQAPAIRFAAHARRASVLCPQVHCGSLKANLLDLTDDA
ncbi:MAG: hypothetical protein MK101_08390 [Phycisphaerales bacterium]|nr:hypothetical protein [Phycisphaerales bacterium]